MRACRVWRIGVWWRTCTTIARASISRHHPPGRTMTPSGHRVHMLRTQYSFVIAHNPGAGQPPSHMLRHPHLFRRTDACSANVGRAAVFMPKCLLNKFDPSHSFFIISHHSTKCSYYILCTLFTKLLLLRHKYVFAFINNSHQTKLNQL